MNRCIHHFNSGLRIECLDRMTPAPGSESGKRNYTNYKVFCHRSLFDGLRFILLSSPVPKPLVPKLPRLNPNKVPLRSKTKGTGADTKLLQAKS